MITSIVGTATAEHWNGPGPWWPVFPIVWFLIIAGVIATFVIVSRRQRGAAGRQSGEARLAERFAAGEIEEVEYEERLTTLRRLGSR
jgi:putative membrane protein